MPLRAYDLRRRCSSAGMLLRRNGVHSSPAFTIAKADTGKGVPSSSEMRKPRR